MTLQERLLSSDFSPSEERLRALGEGLCVGLLRLHDGLGIRHGALSTFNIRVSSEGSFSLWSVPTVTLGNTTGKDSEKAPTRDTDWLTASRLALKQADSSEAANARRWVSTNDSAHGYLAPEEPKGSPLSDVYSIGAILCCAAQGRSGLCEPLSDRTMLERLQALSISEDLTSIIFKCLETDPLDRILGVKKLAVALNPESVATDIEVAPGIGLVQTGLSQLRDSRPDGAMASFDEASRKDRFSVAVWNNLAVTQMRQARWMDAIYDLEKAYKLSSSHPIVSSNIAYCMLHLGDRNAASYWAHQARSMNPGLLRPHLLLGELALQRGRPDQALPHATEGLRRGAGTRIARSFLARVYRAQGWTDKAEQERFHAEALPENPPLLDCLIDERNQAPWGPIRTEHDGGGPSRGDGFSGVPRRPLDPRPSAAATLSLEDEDESL